MKNIIFSLFFVLSIFVVGAAAQAGKPADPKPTPSPSPAPSPKAEPASLAGKWSLVADAGGQTVDILLEVTQKGEEFTGTTSSPVGNGTVDGGKIKGKTFTAILHADVQGQSVDFNMEGTIDGDKISGTFTNAGFGSIPFSAAKVK